MLQRLGLLHRLNTKANEISNCDNSKYNNNGNNHKHNLSNIDRNCGYSRSPYRHYDVRRIETMVDKEIVILNMMMLFRTMRKCTSSVVHPFRSHRSGCTRWAGFPRTSIRRVHPLWTGQRVWWDRSRILLLTRSKAQSVSVKLPTVDWNNEIKPEEILL